MRASAQCLVILCVVTHAAGAPRSWCSNRDTLERVAPTHRAQETWLEQSLARGDGKRWLAAFGPMLRAMTAEILVGCWPSKRRRRCLERVQRVAMALEPIPF